MPRVLIKINHTLNQTVRPTYIRSRLEALSFVLESRLSVVSAAGTLRVTVYPECPLPPAMSLLVPQVVSVSPE